MDKIGQVRDPDRVHLFARQEDVEDRIHQPSAISHQPSAFLLRAES
jgi:hypothetical protein